MKSKIMKTLVFLGLIIISMNGFTQTDTPAKAAPEQRATKHTEWMKANLQLTDEQVQQVDPINLDCAIKIDSIRNIGSGKIQKFKQLRAVQDYREKEFEKILSADQLQKYKDKRKELAQKAKDNRQK